MSDEGIVQAVFGRSMADLMAINPEIKASMSRRYPVNYDDFVNQIDIDLENIISNTESGKQHHLTKGEDEIDSTLNRPAEGFVSFCSSRPSEWWTL
ncbi:hypothetical protein [Vibrio harveyi]|uniref:hypothetical protein n=1 Tax=Vibrio harveyi TaxID=669 RepID=UPI00217D36E2|nr:hypothetical protein [Vibrio harveyi]